MQVIGISQRNIKIVQKETKKEIKEILTKSFLNLVKDLFMDLRRSVNSAQDEIHTL